MTVRVLFWEDDTARSVTARLRSAGFEATLLRGRLAGEDDDEDHPWQVLTDAPPVLLERLAEEHDGWLDDASEAPADRPAPLDLPDGPRRVKGHVPRE